MSNLFYGLNGVQESPVEVIYSGFRPENTGIRNYKIGSIWVYQDPNNVNTQDVYVLTGYSDNSGWREMTFETLFDSGDGNPAGATDAGTFYINTDASETSNALHVNVTGGADGWLRIPIDVNTKNPPIITSGSGAPTSPDNYPNGTMYIDTDGLDGANIYLRSATDVGGGLLAAEWRQVVTQPA